MSQAGLNNTSGGGGGVPSNVATSYVTDNGIAVPALNILNVLANDTSNDDDDGITAIGSGNTVTIQLTNRVQGGATTTDSTPTTIITFPATSAGTYIFEVKASAFNVTDTLGSGYSLFGTARSNGTDTFLVGTPDKIVNEEVGMSSCDFSMTVGGLGNTNIIFQVTGLVGKNINWCSVGLYCVRGA